MKISSWNFMMKIHHDEKFIMMKKSSWWKFLHDEKFIMMMKIFHEIFFFKKKKYAQPQYWGQFARTCVCMHAKRKSPAIFDRKNGPAAQGSEPTGLRQDLFRVYAKKWPKWPSKACRRPALKNQNRLGTRSWSPHSHFWGNRMQFMNFWPKNAWGSQITKNPRDC